MPTFPACAHRRAPFNINRRRPVWGIDYGLLRQDRRLKCHRHIVLAPYKKGVVDRNVMCIALRDQSGAVRSIVWSYACHAAFYPNAAHVSADFPGLVRDHLRDIYGANCCVIHLPGLAGSAIPQIAASWRDLTPSNIIRLLLFHPILPRFTLATFRTWSEQLASATADCVRSAIEVSQTSDLVHASTRTERLFLRNDDTASHGEKASPDIFLDMVRLDFEKGGGVIAITGEMIGEWLPILRAHVPESYIITGYLGGPCLYVPTDKAVREGGYEADRFRKWFGLDGAFETGIDNIVTAGAARLMSAAP